MVSLYLARSADRARLRGEVAINLVRVGVNAEFPDCVVISVTNVGRRKVVINRLAWRTGWLRPEHAVLVTEGLALSAPMPAPIDDGETARWVIQTKEKWFEELAQLLLPRWRYRLFTFGLTARTSLGEEIRIRPHASFRARLKATCQRLS